MELFKKLNARLSVDLLIKASSEPFLLNKIPLGKYRGEAFQDVSKKDRLYFSWLTRIDTDDMNLRFTLDYFKKPHSP
jgi:hypothetical protein